MGIGDKHVIALDEGHLRRVLRSYARYYNESRTHRSLNKDNPIHRAIESLGAIIVLTVEIVAVRQTVHGSSALVAPLGGSSSG